MIGGCSLEFIPDPKRQEEIQLILEDNRELHLERMVDCNFPDECGRYNPFDFYVDGDSRMTNAWKRLSGVVALTYYIGPYKTI